MKDAPGIRNFLGRGSSNKLFTSLLYHFLFDWQHTEVSMTGFQPSIYCLYIFLPETCGLKSILPFSWPWRINTSKSLYCKKQWSPMFLSQMRAFIMHWLLQLDFSAPKKKKKTKKNKKWERKWDCPRAEHWRFLDCCRLMDVVAKVFSLTFGVATKVREDVYIGLGWHI